MATKYIYLFIYKVAHVVVYTRATTLTCNKNQQKNGHGEHLNTHSHMQLLLQGTQQALSYSTQQKKVSEKWQHQMVSTMYQSSMANMVSSVCVSPLSFYFFSQSLRFLSQLSSLCLDFLVLCPSNLKPGKPATHIYYYYYQCFHFVIL